MTVRFTNDILSRQTLFDLGNITETLAKTQQQLSSGKRITAPEDDPYGSGLLSRMSDGFFERIEDQCRARWTELFASEADENDVDRAA